MSCPELVSFLEANREAIKAEIIKILLQQMLLAANAPDGARCIHGRISNARHWTTILNSYPRHGLSSALEKGTPEQRRTRSMPMKFKVYQIPKAETKL